MKLRITLEISDKADPQAVLEYIQDMLRGNRYIKWFTIQPKRVRKEKRR